MSVQAARSFLDDIPSVGENKVVYTPVAVFGYIGYRYGFELELFLPTWIITADEIIATTPFEMVVVSLVVASFTIALVEQGDVDITHDLGSQKTPFEIASNFMLFLGLFGGFTVALLHIWSLYSIYVTGIYSDTLIGLLLSLYQLLVLIDSPVSFVVSILHEFVHYMLKKLML